MYDRQAIFCGDHIIYNVLINAHHSDYQRSTPDEMSTSTTSDHFGQTRDDSMTTTIPVDWNSNSVPSEGTVSLSGESQTCCSVLSL